MQWEELALSNMSNLQSQTSAEYSDLIKYEYNLASCYETEYLLSLKLQESSCYNNTIQTNMNSDSISSCSYDDGYEVSMVEAETDREQNQVMTSDSDTVDLSSIQNSVHVTQYRPESMDTTNDTSSYHFKLSAGEFQPPSSLFRRAPFNEIQIPSVQKKDEFTIQSGFSLMGDMGHGNAHCEGPARKRARVGLHQDF